MLLWRSSVRLGKKSVVVGQQFNVVARRRLRRSFLSSNSTNAATNNNDASVQRTPAPGPSFFQGIRAAARGDLTNRAVLQQWREQYGDVVGLYLGQPLIIVFDPDLFMEMLRQEWSLPNGAGPVTWPVCRFFQNRSNNSDGNNALPLSIIQGEAWREPRHIIQKHMFAYDAVDEHQSEFTNVMDDVTIVLRDDPIPADLRSLLMNTSFEMIAQALLGKRMGLIDGSAGAREQKFVDRAVEAFHELGPMIWMPPFPSFLPPYRRFESAMDDICDIGMQLLEEAEQRLPEGAVVTGLFNSSMSREERLVNLLAFLQAGVDTTSNSFCWTLYELARRPTEQQRLREELRDVLPDGDYHRKLLPQLPYLRGFNREVHRISPTAMGTVRKLPFDVNIGKYHVEKNSMIIFAGGCYNMDPDLIGADPDVFAPTRWCSAEKVGKDDDPRKPIANSPDEDDDSILTPAPILSHPLLSTPFGVGPRMCIGARLAQAEINTLLAKICYNFRLSLDPPNQDIRTTSKLVLTPDPMPRIRFEYID